jgi:hypothetical protein
MAIKIYPNRIEFEKYSLLITSNGLLVTSNADPSNSSAYGCLTFADRTNGSSFQGTVSGFVSAGWVSPPYVTTNRIDKFPFFAVGSATCVGAIYQSRYGTSGQSSQVSGYNSSGYLAGPTWVATIDKFPFSIAAGSIGTNVGSLTRSRQYTAGHSSSENGYVSGGWGPPTCTDSRIDRFPFATDSGSTCVGNLLIAKESHAGHSSTTNGYESSQNCITKFPFATSSNSSFVGSQFASRGYAAGVSSSTHGYTAGGSPVTSVIEKFPFASDTSASCVGNLTVLCFAMTGVSATTHGYSAGGGPNAATIGIIDRFPFASDGSATCIGCLTQGRYTPAGQQD